MPWSDEQKAVAVRACRACGIDDERRYFILVNCSRDKDGVSRAKYDKHGRAVDVPTSTSARLNDSDFEHFMAAIEGWCGGQIKTTRRDGSLVYPCGHWQAKASNETQRQQFKAQKYVNTLVAAGVFNEGSLAGWISKMTNGAAQRMEQLSASQMSALLEGLKDYTDREMRRIEGQTWKPWRSMQEV